MDALHQHLILQARANRLANRRLHAAMAASPGFDAAAFHAPRTGFFPSLAATLNHILAVDGYYLDALEAVPVMEANWRAFVPATTLQELMPRQAASDQRLIDWCAAHPGDELLALVAMDRGNRTDHDPAHRVLAHLFMHQTHHRGQAHAMLSGSAVAPPQLDEFLLRSDARFRGPDLAALGWTEALLGAEDEGPAST